MKGEDALFEATCYGLLEEREGLMITERRFSQLNLIHTQLLAGQPDTGQQITEARVTAKLVPPGIYFDEDDLHFALP